MKILINTTSVRLGGGITVIRNLLPALTAVDEGRNEYVVFGGKDVQPQLDVNVKRVRFVTSRLADRSVLKRLFGEQIELPARSLLESVDVVLSPANIAVLACPRPQVLMFQNAAPFDQDVVERCPSARRWRFLLLRELGMISARLANRIVFISDFQRDLILPQLHVSPAKASRIYLGRDSRFHPGARDEFEKVATHLDIARPYLLSASQFYGYKNFVELVIGFARACRALPSNVQLLIAGAEHEKDYANMVRRTISREGIAKRVRLLGHVPYVDLPALYAGAEMFLFPTTCESFPNILIEAMASGTPTISSNRASMRELAGDAAVYFDPFEPDDIASQIIRLWHNVAARHALGIQGVASCQRYSWDQMARQLLDVLKEAV